MYLRRCFMEEYTPHREATRNQTVSSGQTHKMGRESLDAGRQPTGYN